MSNSYCEIDQFYMLYDQRVLEELSNDDDERALQATNVQFLLDTAASELESQLQGKYALPVVDTNGETPYVLIRWVAVKAMQMLFGRRNSRPKAMEQDVAWADDWIERVNSRIISIPLTARSAVPALTHSESKTGASRFSPGALFFDRPPTKTATDNPDDV